MHNINFDNLGKILNGELHKSFWQDKTLALGVTTKIIYSTGIQVANKNWNLSTVLYQNLKF